VTLSLVLLVVAAVPILLTARIWERLRRPWWLDLFGLGATYLLGTGAAVAGWFLTTPDPFESPWLPAVALVSAMVGGSVTVAWARLAGIPMASGRVPLRTLALGFPVGLGTAALAGLWAAAASLVLPPEEQLVGLALDEAGGLPVWARVSSALLAVSLIPLVEEALFRGVGFGVIERRFGASVALTVTAAAFGLLHGTGPVVLAATTSYGVAWGWLRARTGSIWPGVVAHVTTNLVAILLG